MRRIAAQMAAFAVFYVYQQGTAVGTIQRADGVSHFRHFLIIELRGDMASRSAARAFILEENASGRLRQPRLVNETAGTKGCFLKTGFYNVAAVFGVTIILRSSAMRRLIPALLLVSLAGLAFGQGQPGGSWSLGGFGSVLYPGMGHAPTATPPIGQFASNGFSRGFANPGGVRHPQHGSTVIVPYPVYYGGYYGSGTTIRRLRLPTGTHPAIRTTVRSRAPACRRW